MTWPETLLDAWLANVPHVLAHRRFTEESIRLDTPRGAYTATLALTDNSTEAANAQMDVLESRIKQYGAQ